MADLTELTNFSLSNIEICWDRNVMKKEGIKIRTITDDRMKFLTPLRLRLKKQKCLDLEIWTLPYYKEAVTLIKIKNKKRTEVHTTKLELGKRVRLVPFNPPYSIIEQHGARQLSYLLALPVIKKPDNTLGSGGWIPPENLLIMLIGDIFTLLHYDYGNLRLIPLILDNGQIIYFVSKSAERHDRDIYDEIFSKGSENKKFHLTVNDSIIYDRDFKVFITKSISLILIGKDGNANKIIRTYQ